MTNWQPIATAPKDGTRVLLWTPPSESRGGPSIIFGHFEKNEFWKNGVLDSASECWHPDLSGYTGWLTVLEPTMWAPEPGEPAAP